jgi:ribosomal protein S18 acetylase RimI-like enzyme
MKIRRATIKDADGISKVLKESYNIDSLDEGIKAFATELKNGVNYIVAEDNGKIVGLTTWVMHGLPKHGLFELDRIAVLPKVMGKGIAKELFRELINDAKKEYEKDGKKIRKLFLLTHASNQRAHSFYEKMGMKHEATLPKHYYDKEDEWVYSIFIK